MTGGERKEGKTGGDHVIVKSSSLLEAIGTLTPSNPRNVIKTNDPYGWTVSLEVSLPGSMPAFVPLWVIRELLQGEIIFKGGNYGRKKKQNLENYSTGQAKKAGASNDGFLNNHYDSRRIRRQRRWS